MNDDPLYARRRIDQMTDQRLASIEDRQRENGHKLDELDVKVDGLTTRLSLMAGGLAVLSVAINLVAPILLRDFFNH